MSDDVQAPVDYDRKVEALHESTRRLIQQDSKSAVAETAVEAAAEILGLPLTSVHFIDDERDRLCPTVVSDVTADVLGEPPALPVDGSLAGRAFTEGESVAYQDPGEYPGVYNPDTPLESEVILPLGDHGVLLTGSTDPSAFSDTDVSLVTILADNTAAALDRIEREVALVERERELADKNERLETFSSMVSHDLRNPLNVAQGYLELARSTGDHSHLSDVEAAHDRMEQLIADLLALAVQGRELGDVAPVSIEAVATDAWSQVDTGSARLDVDACAGSVTADRERLRTCFENLFRNAVEHGSANPPSQARRDTDDRSASSPRSSPAREDALERGPTSSPSTAPGDGAGTESGAVEPADDDGTSVTVRVGTTDDGFFVEDDGVGIPAPERDDVFEAGYTDAEHGTGMGLAIVSEVAQAHDWTVSVRDGTDGGARFEFTVPDSDEDGFDGPRNDDET